MSVTPVVVNDQVVVASALPAQSWAVPSIVTVYVVLLARGFEGVNMKVLPSSSSISKRTEVIPFCQLKADITELESMGSENWTSTGWPMPTPVSPDLGMWLTTAGGVRSRSSLPVKLLSASVMIALPLTS